MKLTALGLSAGALLLVFGGALAVRGARPAPEGFDEYFRYRLVEGRVPGGWVAVIHDGRVVKSAVYGFADVDGKVPVQASTYMHIGSVCKMFTAACVGRLVKDGKVALNDSITKWFSGAPTSWKAVTVRNLLNQTSGLPDYLRRRALDFDTEYTSDEMLAALKDLEPAFTPGSSWEYSNTNYLLLGLLVEKASGMSFGGFLKQKVSTPAGVKSVYVDGSLPSGSERSKGYWGGDLAVAARPVSKSMSLTADGCLWANVDGFLEWDKALDRLSGLPKGLRELFWNSARLPDGSSTGYGAGWSIDSVHGEPVYWHDGGWQGFSSFYARFPCRHLAIVVCINGGDADADQLGFDLMDRYLGR